MDLFEKLLQDRGPLGSHSKMAHGYYAFPKLEGEIAPRMTFRGKEVLTWSLNNYLGLANHPEIRKADADASAEFGLAYPMGARMMSGNSNLIEEFESELSSFVGKEDTMVLNFGYQGIMSVIDALLDRKDVVVYDSECHACIIDGLRMHVGKRFVFPHNDIENCEKQLQRATKLVEETGGAILLITEGVFGMLGDQGKLKEIAALKDKYQFRMLVDDAHGFGTLGKTGAGAGEEQGCQDAIDIYFSTFAKSMASVGAFISSDEQVIEYLRYNTRSQIFAKTLPMPLVKGNLKRLEMLRTMPELKDKLWEVATALQNSLKENGFDIGLTDTPVTPVFLQGGQNEAVNMVMDLRENFNIFCSVVVYPVVPKGVIMLRLIPTATHTIADVEETISAFKAVKHKLESGEYANAEPQIFS
ncbi:aminotransferase class I/II-fold pyridoxal phosphate-dependent enzyme [Flammeovirga agarivorans]|uniref:Pyridoxal phosphate-dependent aminotransferase family protein n=1 Tax=Flammeovirga agarivorans TaxID=2726742 RepID=A0A7X8SLH3_9BACT|nr:pyridoxal phosphate-dependent aminotransferase family protein [Flammeovirga agarivorans]NLR92439.1 pyridoxal phosphate-dependent aminotransferase family protein [Flammeovirga agarivorans]